MRINRVISKYDKKTEFLVDEVNVDHIEFSLLKKIFQPPKEDPLMYNAYEISSAEIAKIEKFINVNFDLDGFDYYLECFQA